MQRIRLVKKLAPVINGIDLSRVKVGDVILVSRTDAEILLKEGWAERLGDATEDAEAL